MKTLQEGTGGTEGTKRTQAERAFDIDLGLAVMSAITPPGVCRTSGEIAAVCGCSKSNIHQIEVAALRKLRKWGGAALVEFLDHLQARRLDACPLPEGEIL